MNESEVILCYSGGLDTSVCIPLMRERYGYDRVTTVTVNVGQPPADIRQAEERAQQLGTHHVTIDAKAEFVSRFCWQAVKSNGNYQGYPLSTAIARPLIAEKTVEVARELGVKAFAHGCTGKGNDQFRLELGIRSRIPDAIIHAPMREDNWTRTAEIEYAEERGLELAHTRTKIWSVDENAWGRSVEGGRLEEPDYIIPCDVPDIYQWTASPDGTPDTPAEVVIAFEEGIPVALNGEVLDGITLVERLNHLAGNHGVGRIDMMEDRMLGLKVRNVYECPAAVVLILAHKALEDLVCTHAERKFKLVVDMEWAELAYAGLLGVEPLADDLAAFTESVARRTTGNVTVRLFKGTTSVLSRASRWALYDPLTASFDDNQNFDQRESTGMVKRHGLMGRLFLARYAENNT